MNNSDKVYILKIILIIIIFLSINVLSAQIFKTAQLDLTNDKMYTISNITKEVLLDIEEPIKLKFYKSKAVNTIPGLSAYANRVEEFLQNYSRLSRGKIFLDIFQPEQFSVEEDQAVGFGIQSIPISGSGEVIYFGLAGTNSTDDEDIIPIFRPDRERFLEYDLTKLIYNLSKPEKIVVSVISSLPIASDPQKNYEAWVVYKQATQFFDLRTIGGNIREIDEDINILLVVQPDDLSETTKYAIDQFILRGGKMLAFIDPHVETKKRNNRQKENVSEKRHGLYDLFQPWGIDVDFNSIIGDKNLAQRVTAISGGRRVVTSYLPWLSIDQRGLDRDDVITSEIERVNVASAGFISLINDSNLTMEPLVFSSKATQLLDSDKVIKNPNPVQMLSDFKKTSSNLPIAARVSGNFKTSFPNGPPNRTDQVNDTKPDPILINKHLNQSKEETSIIIVADSDMLADQIWLRSGGELAIPIAQNNDLFINMLDNLSGSIGLMSLRGRGLSNRPFILVQNIQKESELKYRTKERELLKNLEDTEKKISSLRREDKGNFMLSPSQKKMIEDFRLEIVKIRSQLRTVQHDLQKDIDNIHTQLKIINIGLIPGIIGIVAIIIFLFRQIKYRNRILDFENKVYVGKK